MKKKQAKMSWSVRTLLALGIPMVLIPGLLLAHQRGWNPDVRTAFQQPVRYPHSGMVKAGFAKVVMYQDRGELKYEKRLKKPNSLNLPYH